MRKIIFDEAMIESLRVYLEEEHHTTKEAANKFGVSEDTIRRVRYENDIRPGNTKSHHENAAVHVVSDDQIKEIIGLFKCTDTRMQDICKAVKLENYVVQRILRQYFTEEEIKDRKARLYRKSKLGDKNSMFGKRGAETYNWQGGIVPDGQGYLMATKPDWYTGRKGSDYIFYHSLVMCEALGITEIPKGFAVHHIDHNPLNNNINNLALVQMGAHSRLHAIEKKMMLQGSETIRRGVGEDGAETPDLNRPEEDKLQ